MQIVHWSLSALKLSKRKCWKGFQYTKVHKRPKWAEYSVTKRKWKISDSVLWLKPIYQQIIQKAKWQHKLPPKPPTKQQWRTHLRRSVGVTTTRTGLVNLVYGIPTFQLTAKAVIKGHTFKKNVNNPPYKDRWQTANQRREAIHISTQTS